MNYENLSVAHKLYINKDFINLTVMHIMEESAKKILAWFASQNLTKHQIF